jgi:tetratricopeptide (TPR) repeat protein
MRSPDSNKLIDFAGEKVLAATGNPLTREQEKILEQVFAGKKLKDIQIVGYEQGTVERRLAPQLWKLLSEVFGTDIGFKRVQLVLENEFDKAKSLPTSKAILSTHLPTHLPTKQGDANWDENSGERSPTSSPSLSPPSPLPSPPPSPPQTPNILHNLPAKTCTTFVGRTEELTRLLSLLSPTHPTNQISIHGVGGVGKTTLVLEAAYRCLHASCESSINRLEQSGNPDIPRFDTIIFTSAKTQYLNSIGILNTLSPHRTLTDILRQISRVIEELDLTGCDLIEQVELTLDVLRKRRSTLLIIDNLETVTHQEQVLAFLHELPSTVKVVITTREQIISTPVRLTAMPERDGLSLIQYQADLMEVALEERDRRQLYQATGGIPVVIHYAVGQLMNGSSIAEVVHKLSQPTGDVAQFCFMSSIQLLWGDPAHPLLMALAFFPVAALPNALKQVADIPTIDSALVRLRNFSLIKQEQDRYTLSPLLRESVLTELNAHPEFAQAARQRWVNWYLEFTSPYAELDVGEWGEQNLDELTTEWQNLQAVMEWCMATDCYSEVLKLWQNLKAYTQVKGRHISRLGCWSDRLLWTEWLMHIAEQRGDWRSLIQVTLDHTWTLTSIGKPKLLKDAEQWLIKAWNLRYDQDVAMQANVAKSIAVLYMEQHRFEEAQTWLQQAEELLPQAQPKSPSQQRLWVQLLIYSGMILFKTEVYEPAKEKFTLALKQATQINWVRAQSITQNCLAEIAIEQGQFDHAQQLIVDGLQVAEEKGDRTRIAYYQRTMAKLMDVQAQQLEAVRWGTQALESFDILGMELESKETRFWLDAIAISH